MKDKKDSEPKKGPLSNYARYSGIAFQMIATIILGAWIGSKLDEYYQVKNHWFTVVLLIFSVIASIYMVIRSLLRNND